MNATLSLLDSRAYRLYDLEASAEDFLRFFTKDELIQLWSICCDDLDTAYDDEVYDALYQLGHFKEVN